MKLKDEIYFSNGNGLPCLRASANLSENSVVGFSIFFLVQNDMANVWHIFTALLKRQVGFASFLPTGFPQDKCITEVYEIVTYQHKIMSICYLNKCQESQK